MFGLKRKKLELPTPEEALPGRTDRQMRVADKHTVLGHPLKGPWPEGIETAIFGLGCFWGAERKFWQQPGVYSTAVGYLGGHTPNATYEEVCSGMTGHNEAVLVAYDPKVISYSQLLKVFFESHDPTQGMRQGGDIGTQYRSGIYTLNDDQALAANDAKATYGAALRAKGFDAITTEVLPAPDFFYAEDYHQQYLDKNPQGYCGLGGTGVACQIGTGVAAE